MTRARLWSRNGKAGPLGPSILPPCNSSCSFCSAYLAARSAPWFSPKRIEPDEEKKKGNKRDEQAKVEEERSMQEEGPQHVNPSHKKATRMMSRRTIRIHLVESPPVLANGGVEIGRGAPEAHNVHVASCSVQLTILQLVQIDQPNMQR
jgi:hypothetical protein